MTPEELDEAIAKEAGGDAVKAARMAREGWKPPEPVDPDLLAFREWLAKERPNNADYWLSGGGDKSHFAQAFLAGACMATERERERIKELEAVVAALNWLATRTNFELSWSDDDEDGGEWRVFEVTGGVNDREWHLVATGQTPGRALMNARAKYEESLK